MMIAPAHALVLTVSHDLPVANPFVCDGTAAWLPRQSFTRSDASGARRVPENEREAQIAAT
jgi:hypothetical protein